MINKFLSWLRKSKLYLLQFLIYLGIFIFAGFKILSYYSDKLYVKKDFLITQGIIVKYDEFGVGPNRYLTYSYMVNGILYKRQINGPKRTYDECANDISKCADKRFYVIYSKKNPGRSLIDLTQEVQGLKEPDFPNSLTNFQ